MLLYSFDSFQINLTFCFIFIAGHIHLYPASLLFSVFPFFFLVFLSVHAIISYGCTYFFYSPGAWSRDRSVAGTKSGISHIPSLHLVGARGITRLVVGSISTCSAGNITRHHSMRDCSATATGGSFLPVIGEYASPAGVGSTTGTENI